MPGVVDLVRWADPYIASLVEKVQMVGGRLLRSAHPVAVRAECPPPTFTEFSNPGREFNWPRRDGWRNAT